MKDDRGRLLSTPLVIKAARGGIVAWSLIGLVVLAFVVIRFVILPIHVIFPPLVVAMIGVYLLNPIVSGLERRGVNRLLGTLFTYLVGVAIFGTVLYFAIPLVAEQVSNFGEAAPALVDRVVTPLQEFAARVGLPVGEATGGGGEGVVDWAGRLLSWTRGLFDIVLVFVLGPILAFYFLVDLPKIRRALKAVIPERRRTEVEGVMQEIGRAIGGFFRGQLLVSLFVGVASAIGLFIVGLPFWAVVGLVAGLFNLIPLIGPFIGGIVAALIAFTTETGGEGLLNLEPGVPLAVGSAIALLIVQQIDNHILSPNIVARTVHLHPVTVMLGLLTGGTLLGLWGMLLAIPVLATIKILLLHAWDTRGVWPPPSGEQDGIPDGHRASSPPPSTPVERVLTAKEPARETERRGSWWTNTMRVVFGVRKDRPGQPASPRSEAREPERTAPKP